MRRRQTVLAASKCVLVGVDRCRTREITSAWQGGRVVPSRMLIPMRRFYSGPPLGWPFLMAP